MPVAQNAFEICFAELGGRLSTMPGNAEILSPEWFKRRYWDYLTKFGTLPLYRAALVDTYLDYINNSALNAVVGSSEHLGLIGLFLGSVENLRIFFDVLLSHPAIFRSVGDPDEQSMWFEDLSAWDWELSVALAWESFRTQKGSEPTLAKGERQHFAAHLQMFALDFLFFHELGHWCNGHDIFARRYKSNLFISELGMDQLPSIPNQLLELNADSFAVILMTGEWLQVKFGPLSIFQSPLEALRMWATAMAFTFILFGQERNIHVVRPIGIHPHPALLGPYPHPAMRLQNMQQTAMHIASRISASAVSVMAQALDEGISAAIEVCQKLKMPSSIWYADSETVSRTYQALMMEWAALYNSEVTACTRMAMPRSQ